MQHIARARMQIGHIETYRGKGRNMNEPELTGQPAEIQLTLTITRAETGLTEEVKLVGHVAGVEPPITETKEQKS